MTLQDFFNGQASATLILKGDCNVRGYMNSPVVCQGERFETPLGGDFGYTFVADKVTVKTLSQITRDELSRSINGPMVAPLLPGDEGPMKPTDLCTVIEFSPKTAQSIPVAFLNPRMN